MHWRAFLIFPAVVCLFCAARAIAAGSSDLPGRSFNAPAFTQPESTAVPPAAEEGEKSQKEAQPRNIQQVIEELKQEAVRALKKGNPWPRRRSNYAQQKNLSLSDQKVFEALSRRLARRPAVDAYIKWQLLSFAPDFTKLGRREIRSLLQGMPGFVPRPTPKPRARRLLRRASQHPVPRAGQRLKNVIKNREAAVARVEKLNAPAVKYRNTLIEQVPVSSGVRLRYRLQDVVTRFRAGVPSYKQAIRKLLAQAKGLSEGALSPVAHRRLVAQVKRLHKLKNPKIASITLRANGMVALTRIGTPFHGLQYKHLLNYLNANQVDRNAHMKRRRRPRQRRGRRMRRIPRGRRF